MIIVFIRRFVRLDKESEFLANYGSQKPLDNPAFKGETLTKVSDSSDLPPELRTFALNGPACLTYVNVAKWESWEAFAEQFKEQLKSGSFNPEIETAPRQRAVLEVVEVPNPN
jgi:hypothetical protein